MSSLQKLVNFPVHMRNCRAVLSVEIPIFKFAEFISVGYSLFEMDINQIIFCFLVGDSQISIAVLIVLK